MSLANSSIYSSACGNLRSEWKLSGRITISSGLHYSGSVAFESLAAAGEFRREWQKVAWPQGQQPGHHSRKSDAPSEHYSFHRKPSSASRSACWGSRGETEAWRYRIGWYGSSGSSVVFGVSFAVGSPVKDSLDRFLPFGVEETRAEIDPVGTDRGGASGAIRQLRAEGKQRL